MTNATTRTSCDLCQSLISDCLCNDLPEFDAFDRDSAAAYAPCKCSHPRCEELSIGLFEIRDEPEEPVIDTSELCMSHMGEIEASHYLLEVPF